MLETIRLRYAARLRTLDENHPLVTRTKGKGQTRLLRTARLLPESERPLLLEPKHTTRTQQIRSSETTADTMRWILSIPPTDITLYTDGSQDAAGNTRLGYVGFQRGYKVCEGYQSLGTAAEVYDAEIIAIEAGIRAAA